MRGWPRPTGSAWSTATSSLPNLMIAVRGGETDVAKVLDFGLVKPTHDPNAVALSAEMTVSGTPQYMAPEQAMADRSLDARADIYALGAMMYFALTARPPFTGDSPFAVMMAHARDPVEPPSRHRATFPRTSNGRPVLPREEARGSLSRCRALAGALAACACASDWNDVKADEWWIAQAKNQIQDSSPSPPSVLYSPPLSPTIFPLVPDCGLPYSSLFSLIVTPKQFGHSDRPGEARVRSLKSASHHETP